MYNKDFQAFLVPLPPVLYPGVPNVPPDTDIADNSLYLQFESLGSNCEFGLVQRHAGIEPLGLFRFSEIDLSSVAHGLHSQFAGIEEFRLDVDASGGYMATGTIIRNVTHTWLYPDAVTPETAAAKFKQRQIFLRRLMLEQLGEAEKIFLYRASDQPPWGLVEDVMSGLRRYGPNVLMLVTAAQDGARPGDVEAAGKGLLRGYLDKTPHNVSHDTISYELWSEICQRAIQLLPQV